MRTTVTLDEDTAAEVRSEMMRTGHSFKRALNDLIRRGTSTAVAGRRRRFRVRAQPIGLPEGLTYDNVEELLDRLEEPTHR